MKSILHKTVEYSLEIDSIICYNQKVNYMKGGGKIALINKIHTIRIIITARGEKKYEVYV